MFNQGEKVAFSQLAEQASEREREQLWVEAQSLWFLASLQTTSAENRAWAACRSEFCRRRAERQGATVSELHIEMG
ncbi:ANR family transcriptional regulator [Serratia fonticola]|uniref:ANR family transcriptional regulator n=1 Tax=Serratia fonticola TaxID=47917 RepID=UPI00358DA6A9